jgi:hypothetical protein
MSLLGELSFFLGLQIRQSNQGIFISQTKYIREMPEWKIGVISTPKMKSF